MIARARRPGARLARPCLAPSLAAPSAPLFAAPSAPLFAAPSAPLFAAPSAPLAVLPARLLLALLLVVLPACPPPRAPSAPPASIADATVEVGRVDHVLAGVAGDGTLVFAALSTRSASGGATPGAAAAAASPAAPAAPSAGPPATRATTTIEALRLAAGAAPVWRAEVAGHGGPLVAAGGLVVAAVGGSGSAAGVALRGEPGAVVVALDAATGAPTWKLAVDATDWAVVAQLAATGDGVVIAGSFSGTLRIADRVVSSAGRTDGFVARLTATGGLAWLIRLGGPGADAVHGVASSTDRIAIAGSFAAGADLLGEPLTAVDDRSPRGDGFVAELAPSGSKRWVQSFGGKANDAVAGVAIDAAGRIAVAATAQDAVHVGSIELVASGTADGLIAWWGPGGSLVDAVLLGGADFDGLRAIAAAGDRVVVAGFYSGSIRLGDRALTAGGGDDAFAASLDPSGRVAGLWPISGDGREEVTALAAVPGGFVAGIAHTAAARIDDAALPSPADPMSGAAIAVRGVR